MLDARDLELSLEPPPAHGRPHPSRRSPKDLMDDLEHLVVDAVSTVNEELAIVGMQVRMESEVPCEGAGRRFRLRCTGETGPRQPREAVLLLDEDHLRLVVDGDSVSGLCGAVLQDVDSVVDLMLSAVELIATRRP